MPTSGASVQEGNNTFRFAAFFHHDARLLALVMIPLPPENQGISAGAPKMVRLCAFDFSTVCMPVDTTVGSEIHGEHSLTQQAGRYHKSYFFVLSR